MAAPYPLAMPYPDWLAAVADDPVYAWAISGWNRAAAVEGAWFDHAKAARIVEQWPRIFRLTNDRFRGVPFRLVKWQEITVRLLVGWKKPVELIDPATHEPSVEHVRVFRRLDLWIPRKNGKSEFLAALGVLFFVLEKVNGGEGYVFAKNQDQGRIAFNKMQDIIREAVGIMDDRSGNQRIALFRDSIYIRETGSTCYLLTGSPDGKHGRSPTVIIGDEIHEWKSTELSDTLRQGTGTRLQPIELYASTAGFKDGRIGYEWFEESVAIACGEKDDKSTLSVIFAIGDEDDWQDEATWKKANPSLGLTPTIDFMRGEYAKAKGRATEEAKFKAFHLNCWADVVSGWLPRAKWDACTTDAGSWKDMWKTYRGRKAYLACDVSATQDITALVAVLPPETDDDRWVIIPRFWLPDGNLIERAERDRRVNWKHWVEIGALETTPGDAVDQNFVMHAIFEGLENFIVPKVGFDPWNSIKLKGDLQLAGWDGDLTHDLRQGHQTLGPPTKEFERLVFAEKIEHGGHPVLAWMAGHCTVRFDANLNIVPSKKDSRDKIDGIIAAVMGLGVAMMAEEQQDAAIEVL